MESAFLVISILLFCIFGMRFISVLYVKNVYLIYNFLWIFLIIGTQVIPYGGYTISSKTYWVLFIFLCSLNFGFLILNNKHRCASLKHRKEVFENFATVITQNNKIKAYLCLATLVLFYYACKYHNIVSVNGSANARIYRFFVGPLFESTFELLFYEYIIYPSRYIACLIINLLLFTRKFNVKIVGVSIANILLCGFIGGGRLIFVYLFISLFYSFLILHEFKCNRNLLKHVSMALIALIILLLGMTYLIAYRMGILDFNLQVFLEYFPVTCEQIIGYNIGAISALDIALNAENKLYYGRITLFNGIDLILFYLFSYMGVPYNSAIIPFAKRLNEQFMIGDQYFNALYTALFHFYSDFGFLGIVIFSFLFGLVFRRFIDRVFYSKDLITFAIMYNIFYQLLTMNLTWTCLNTSFILYVVLLFILIKRYNLKYKQFIISI